MPVILSADEPKISAPFSTLDSKKTFAFLVDCFRVPFGSTLGVETMALKTSSFS